MLEEHAMRGRNPLDEIERFFDRMSEQFEESTELPMRMTGGAPADVVDLGDQYEVTMDLPGFEKEDIQVRLSDNTLRISAIRETGFEATSAGGPGTETGSGTGTDTGTESAAETGTGGGETGSETGTTTDVRPGRVNYVRRERRRESVDRSISLPEPVDEESADATLTDGVLRVTLDKAVTSEDSTTIDIE